MNVDFLFLFNAFNQEKGFGNYKGLTVEDK